MTVANLGDIALQIDRVGGPAISRQPLGHLADELRSGGRRLAGVDLLSAYPPETLLPERRGGLTEFLHVLRDLTVFAPIGITWWVLRGAVTAWSHSGSGESLLRYWQTHPRTVVPISLSALYVVGALLVVAFLTLTIAAMERYTDRRLASQRRRLTNALTLASLALSAPTQATAMSGRDVARMADKMYASTDKLEQALSRLGTLLDSGPTAGLGAALNRWSNSADALQRLGQNIVAPAKLIAEFVELRKATTKEEAALRRALNSLIQRLEEAAERSMEEAGAHGQVADGVRDATRQLAGALDTFTERTEFLERLVYQVRQLLTMLELDGQIRPPARDNA